ncbi:hypothetical protein SmJEL517_g00951 [Synchytrium microbalum]|uniref:Formamidopyrimidine-DNA glycosylase catalytic domain-containing protein n=1 Tax=Synchytrium microbalum TaxID=1806994 RepID=A0A507CH30_9FUNG|nr:uncharacterized protein SmJEL517_g00951 [Synchytrium microbalum]TPX36955.1 hypothetical protein SmJEL517_g00951 [Synchytrium microbalum]
MPELPEVERARKIIHGFCGCKVLKCLTVEDSLVFSGISHTDFAKALVGRTITSTGRHGKNFWISLDQAPHAVMHFGMTGSILVKGQKGLEYKDFKTDSETWPPRFHKFILVLSNGSELAFADARRLARVRIVNDILNEPPISELAPDAYLNPPSLPVFLSQTSKRNAPIKSILLDQNAIVAGIGNYLVDEILYQAHVHPGQHGSVLSKEEAGNILTKMAEILKVAVEANADFHQFPQDWLFHHRWGKGKGKLSATSSGQKIIFETVGGRTSAIVPEVQKLRKKKRKADDDGADENEEDDEDDAEEPSEAKESLPKQRKQKAPAKKKAKITKKGKEVVEAEVVKEEVEDSALIAEHSEVAEVPVPKPVRGRKKKVDTVVIKESVIKESAATTTKIKSRSTRSTVSASKNVKEEVEKEEVVVEQKVIRKTRGKAKG